MNQQVATIQQDEALLKKRAAYANLGEIIHTGEMELQMKAQAAILKVKIPSTVEELPEARILLAETKKAFANIESDRKLITGKLKPVVDRLMLPEKSGAEPIGKLEAAIITLTKAHEAAEKAKQAKLDEQKRIVEQIKNYLLNVDHECRSRIGIQVTVTYEHALGKGDIKPGDLKAFLEKASKKLSVLDFEVEKPAIKLNLVKQEELDAIMEAEFKYNPHAYVLIFQKLLQEKFIDYSVAYQNKEAALIAAQKADEKAAADLLVEKSNAEMVAALESSTTMTFSAENVGPEIKSLKKSYEVSMEETFENVKKITAAFFANESKCLAKLQVKKWFSVSPSQYASALAKVKCDDNNFQPQGIIFKEVDKL